MDDTWAAIHNSDSDESPPRLLIRGAAGLGKSTATLDLIQSRFELETLDIRQFLRPVWISMPRIELGEELAEHYGPSAKVIRGRLHGVNDPNLETLCQRPEAVQAAQRAGIREIAKALCSNREYDRVCPYRETCPYYLQYEEFYEVYFIAHETLFTTITEKLMPRPGLLVIEENILSALVPATPGFSPAKIEQHPIGKMIVDELRAGRDPRNAIKKAGLNKTTLRRQALELKAKAPKIFPDMAEATIINKLKHHKPQPLPTILEKLADELNLERSGLRCLTYAADVPMIAEDGSKGTGELLCLRYRRSIRALRKDLPVLVLDATGDAELLSAAIPGLEEIEIAAERNVTVCQTYGYTASMAKLVKGDQRYRDEIANLIEHLAAKHPYGLLVTYKDAEDRIKLPDGWDSEHFGNLRGIDRHKERTAIVIAGRSQVRATDIEKMALGLFYDDETPIALYGKYEKIPVGFQMRDGRLLGIRADRHPDPIVDRVRWQHTEAEVIQAVDRLRLVHREDPALIVLINEVPTIPVDQLMNYRTMARRHGERGAGGGPGSRLAIVFERLGGYLPLRATWLANRFPDLWPSINAARCEIKEAGDLSTILASALGEGHVWTYRFRLVHQRGPRDSVIWASTENIGAVRIWIEAEVGPVGNLEPATQDAVS